MRLPWDFSGLLAEFLKPHPLRHCPKAKPDISAVGDAACTGAPRGISLRVGHPRAETSKRVIVEWSPGLRAVVERLKKLGPQIRPTLLCTLEGKPFTSDGVRSHWHQVMTKATPGDEGEPPVLAERFTFHDLRTKSASDDELEAATEPLTHDDPRTTQRVYRRKPRRASPVQKYLTRAATLDSGGSDALTSLLI